VDYRILGGVTKQIREKANLGLSGGFAFRDHQSGIDSRDFIFNATYDQTISPRTKFRIDAGRTITDTLSAVNRESRTRTIEEAIEERNPTFTQTHFRVGLGHFLTPEISLDLGGRVTLEQQQEVRDDLVYDAAASLTYFIRRNLRLRFAYIFSARKSDTSNATTGGFDFDRHRFVFLFSYALEDDLGAPVEGFGGTGGARQGRI
jgi:hypothetical protein